VEIKKSKRRCSLLTTQHDGIYQKPGKEIYYQEAVQKKRSVEIIQVLIQEVQEAARKKRSIEIIQRTIQEVLLQ